VAVEQRLASVVVARAPALEQLVVVAHVGDRSTSRRGLSRLRWLADPAR
jgi:hypothetical protein